MNRVALTRLITAGNRASRFRLLGIVTGVAIGVALFLLLFAAYQSFGERSERSTWNQAIAQDPQFLSPDNADLSDDEVAAASVPDSYRGDLITVVFVAATANSSVQIPGTQHIPGPGEYVASPALENILHRTPAAELRERYGTPIGTLSPDALEGPDSLVVVVGQTVEEMLALSGSAGPVILSEFSGYDYATRNYEVVAIIGAFAVLIPVLLLISIATDLGAAQRAERFASVRLIGATPKQIAGIAAVETAITTLVGSLIGLGCYLLSIPLASQLEIGSSRFYLQDLLVSPLVVVVTVIAITLGATAVSWWRTYRADVGPLNASRERLEGRPRIWALVPLLIGIALLAAASGIGNFGETRTVEMVLGGFIITTFGLLWAGALLMSWVAKISSTRARNAAQVIGFNHVIRHPRAAFRAVAGLVVAAFSVTVFAVSMTAAAGVSEVLERENQLPLSALYAPVDATASAEAVMAAARDLEASDDITEIAIGFQHPQDNTIVLSAEDARALGLTVPADSPAVAVGFWFIFDSLAEIPESDMQPQAEPDISLQTLTPSYIFINTNGDSGSIERTRTALVTSEVPAIWLATTRNDVSVVTASAMENQFATLAYIGILIAAGLSAISLGVSTLATIFDRQRVFGLLGLIGMPKQTLRRLITYETALPVATILLLSIGLGAFAAWSIVTSLTTTRSVEWPAPGYYAVIALCLVLVFFAIAVTVKAARSIISNANTRFE